MYEDDCFLGWPKVGTGATVKEAFVDWYIKQIGCDESMECQCELL
jgi:hypothetical protein